VERKIVDFRLDEAKDWTAILSCGHPQHTRHRPPFENRSWVLSPSGRDSMKGKVLNCVRCDDFEIPDGLVRFKVTPEFSEATLPNALRSNHQTSEGIWGRIVVLEGQLLYSVMSRDINLHLTPENPGVVVPELPHRVEPIGGVRFFIEFYKSNKAASDPLPRE
jgi:tellurite resistance-related uncharacterized protein